MSIGLKQYHPKTEVIYEHHSSRHSDSISCWRVAYLALQRELGLRSERRVKLGSVGLGRSVANRSDLTGCGNIASAHFGETSKPETVSPKISQDMPPTSLALRGHG